MVSLLPGEVGYDDEVPAAAILDALADAGLLLPPGGTKRTEQWTHAGCPWARTTTTWPDGSSYTTAWTEVTE